MPHTHCLRCEEEAHCMTVVFEEHNVIYMQDTETYLCEGCYDMYRELYTLRVIDDDVNEVIYDNQDTDYQEQVIEDEEEPTQALSSNDESEDPCDLINDVI